MFHSKKIIYLAGYNALQNPGNNNGITFTRNLPELDTQLNSSSFPPNLTNQGAELTSRTETSNKNGLESDSFNTEEPESTSNKAAESDVSLIPNLYSLLYYYLLPITKLKTKYIVHRV